MVAVLVVRVNICCVVVDIHIVVYIVVDVVVVTRNIAGSLFFVVGVVGVVDNVDVGAGDVVMHVMCGSVSVGVGSMLYTIVGVDVVSVRWVVHVLCLRCYLCC